jgi:hypothetical protein
MSVVPKTVCVCVCVCVCVAPFNVFAVCQFVCTYALLIERGDSLKCGDCRIILAPTDHYGLPPFMKV